MTLSQSPELTKLLDGVYECRDGICRPAGISYKLLPSAKFSAGGFGLDVPFTSSLDIDTKRMSVRFPFADGMNRDGVGDLLEVEGIDLSRHRANPIILWDHGKTYTMPVALAAEYDEDSGQYDLNRYTVENDPILRVAHVTAYFYRGKGMNGVEKAREHEHATFCEQLFDMMAKGLVRAGSIGYQVVDARELPPDYRTGTPKGLHLLKTLMLEASAVVLPANGDTVRKALDTPKMCGKPLSPWLIKSLRPYLPMKKVQLGYEPQLDPNQSKPDHTLPCHSVAHPTLPLRTKPQGNVDLANSGAKSMSNPDSKKSQPSDKIDPKKACRVLADGEANGHPLTEKQRGMFGAACGESEKSYATNPLESRDDYENPLSDGNVPNARWEPGLGAIKSIDERGGKFWVIFADGTERGPFGSEEEAMAIHRQPDLSAKGLRAKYRKKAMSSLTEDSGGALRKPPQQGDKEEKGFYYVSVVGTTGSELAWGIVKAPYGEAAFQEVVKKRGIRPADINKDWSKIEPSDKRQYDDFVRRGGKSLDFAALRKQYRSPVRRRLRKSVPGAASMHVSEKDMDAARKLAGEKGVKFERLGETKVKLIGPDEAIDEVAKAFGRRVKAMEVSTKGFVYSIVMDVSPDAAKISSYRPGKWEVDFADNEGKARQMADSFNSHTQLPGLRYYVEKVDEESPQRKPPHRGKDMPKVKTKALPETIEEEDKDMSNPHADEPFGSQSLRHYRQKLMDDMAETEGHLKLLDHEPTKKLLTKMQEHRADMLDEIDSTHAKHYKDLPQFEAQVDPAEGEEELEEVAEAKDVDPMGDDEGTPADSDLEKEPTPEEVIEGMEKAEEDEPDVDQVKRLKGYRKKGVVRISNREDLRQFIFDTDDDPNVRAGPRADAILARPDHPQFGQDWGPYLAKLGYTSNNNWSKSIPEKKEDKEEKKHMCGKCAKAMEDEKEEKSINEKEEKDYPIDTPVPEQAIEDAKLPDSAKDFELADHEKKGISEAGDYLGEMGEPGSVHDDESRHKAWHYAKTLEGIGQVEAHAKESEAAAVEGAEHDIGEGGNKSQIVGDPDYWQEEADEPEHVKMCKGAAGFLKELSNRRDFGDVHREEAKSWHKQLKELVQTGEPLDSEEADEIAEETDIPTPEMSAEKTYEPGEMGEKAAGDDEKEEKRMKALGTGGPYSVDLQTFRSKPTVYFVVDSQGNRVAGPFKTDAQAKQEAAKLNANPNHKTIEPKEEDLKALAQSTQRNKSVLANLNRTLASLNGMLN